MLHELHAYSFHTSWSPPSKGRDSWYSRNVGACLRNQWTSADSSCQYRFKRYSQTYRLRSTILAGLVHTAFQENFTDFDPTLQLPHPEHTSLGATYYDLSYFQRRISNQSVARDYGIVDAIFPTSACLVRETRRGKFMLPINPGIVGNVYDHQLGHQGDTADSEQDGISKKSRKRKGDSELCVTINKLS